MSVGQDLLNVPFAEMVKKLGLGIAEAQFALDEVSLRLAQMMSGEYEVEVPDENDPEKTKIEKRSAYVTFDGQQLSMLELGFTPNFYQFVDTIIEVKMSISMSTERERTRNSNTRTASAIGGGLGFFGGGKARTTSVSASFAAKYQYSAEGSSLLRTKLVPIPPPQILEERIRAIVEREAEKR